MSISTTLASYVGGTGRDFEQARHYSPERRISRSTVRCSRDFWQIGRSASSGLSDEIIEREEPESRSAAFGTGSAWLMVFCRDDQLTGDNQRRRLRAFAGAAGMRLVELASGGHGGIFNFCRSEAADYVVDFTLEVLANARGCR